MDPATYGVSSPPTAARAPSSTRPRPLSTSPVVTSAPPCSTSPNAARSRSPNRAPNSWARFACSIASSMAPRSKLDRTSASSRYPRSTQSGSSVINRMARWSHPFQRAGSDLSACSKARRSATYAARRVFPSEEYVP